MNQRQRQLFQGLRRASGEAIRYARKLLAEPRHLDEGRLAAALRYSAEMERGSGSDFPRAAAAGQALNFSTDPRLEEDVERLRTKVKAREMSIGQAVQYLLDRSEKFDAPASTLEGAYQLALTTPGMSIKDALATTIEQDAEAPSVEEVGEAPDGAGAMQFARDAYGRAIPSPSGYTEAELEEALKIKANSSLSLRAALAHVRSR